MNISEQLDRAAKIVGGRAWGADRGNPRIYMRSARDRKVYFDFPDTNGKDYLGGAALRVFIDDCGQPPAWYAGQKKREMGKRTQEGLALAALEAEAVDLAQAIMDDFDGELTASLVNDVAGDLANGRITEARQKLEL